MSQIIESPDVIAKRKRLREKAVELSQLLVGMMTWAYDCVSWKRAVNSTKKYQDIKLTVSQDLEVVLKLIAELTPFSGEEALARNLGNRFKFQFDKTKSECDHRVNSVFDGRASTPLDPWIHGKRWDELFAILEKAYLIKRRFYQGWTDGIFSNRILRLEAANYTGFKA
ncbi:MAG: hypothetical protein EPN86_06405 [Nanoarchaeota archaeon]|nr:MAG: hypothetical protein EPN86_06405 [Nanoarchaeota archaeon]